VPHNDVATPLRALPTTDDSGVRVIRETGSSWLDGSEEELLERMRSGLPLDSLSDELAATATTWPEQYHLSQARANVVRALDLDRGAVVLEVGAGCGAITRYLGETCDVVDALEPSLPRARVAAARTAELPGVRVFSGELVDVPAEQAYDVVVVVGVLEYVGGGGPQREPYVEFLARLRGLLRPGGHLVLAIENPLGVKYLAGAPEDHSGIVFHSVQGYPEDGPARTFTRRELLGLARAAGFGGVKVLGAFPDYKLTRTVFDEALIEVAPDLAVELPRFPSPDWVVSRPQLLDEGLLWKELVASGAAGDFANSFVLLARNGVEAPSLWNAGRLATYFSLRRRRPFHVVKHVSADTGEVAVTCNLLGSGEQDGLRVLPYREPWQQGYSLLSLALGNPDRLAELVGDWVRLLRERSRETSDGRPIDVLPHNVHYVDGVGRFIDDEWRSDLLSLEQIIARGSLLLARDLARQREVVDFGAETVPELVQLIARAAGVEIDDEGVRAAVEREAEFQARVGGGDPGSEAYESTRGIVLAELDDQISNPVEGRTPEPAWAQLADDRADAIEARDLLFATGKQLDEARAELSAVRAERDELVGASRSWISRGVRGLLRRRGRAVRKLGRSERPSS